LAGPVIHLGAVGQCPHGAPMLKITPGSPRVFVNGLPAALLSDIGTVVGCPFVAGLKPQPCVTARWFTGAARVKSFGVPLLVNPSSGICQSPDQVPNGPPLFTITQTRVVAQ
jgi:hypothetical protein